MHKFHESLTLTYHMYTCVSSLSWQKRILGKIKENYGTPTLIYYYYWCVHADGEGGLIEKKAAASCLHSH